MTHELSQLIIQYNHFMDLCQEFHNQAGTSDIETRAKQLSEISQLFAEITQMDSAAGDLLEAKHYLGIAGELGRIARRCGA